MHCCLHPFAKVYFQVGRYWVGVEVSAFKYSWVLDENGIQESYLNWGAEVIVSFPCTFSRTRCLIPIYTTACIEILTDTARVYTFLNSLPSIWHVPCVWRGQGRGFSLLLDLLRNWHEHTVQIKSFVYSRKAVIKNWKSFSSNSAAPWGPVKKIHVRGWKYFFCRDALRSKGLICQPQLQHRRV